jgi:hypothetical protein
MSNENNRFRYISLTDLTRDCGLLRWPIDLYIHVWSKYDVCEISLTETSCFLGNTPENVSKNTVQWKRVCVLLPFKMGDHDEEGPYFLVWSNLINMLWFVYVNLEPRWDCKKYNTFKVRAQWRRPYTVIWWLITTYVWQFFSSKFIFVRIKKDDIWGIQIVSLKLCQTETMKIRNLLLCVLCFCVYIHQNIKRRLRGKECHSNFQNYDLSFLCMNVFFLL